MTQEQNAKYKRLNDRLNELSQINSNVGKLTFYMQNNELNEETEKEMKRQLEAMQVYRSCLESRITKGIY